MWLEIKKTYIGSLGQFPKGIKQDFPDDVAKQLIKSKYAVECLPIYDEKANFAMRQFNALRQDRLQIRSDINTVNSRLIEARNAAGFISNYEKKIQLLTTRLKKADKELANFAAKNNIPLPKESDEKLDAKTEDAARLEDDAETDKESNSQEKTDENPEEKTSGAKTDSGSEDADNPTG